MDRRDFIKMLGLAGTSAAAYAACSSYMEEALAQSTHTIDDLLTASAECKKGSLADIEHVVFLMQENRSFDHYFGTLRGVRGFGDPRPLTMRDGQPVWNQLQAGASSTPPAANAQRIRPFHLPSYIDNQPAGISDGDTSGSVFLADVPHNYSDGVGAWNNGLMDKWVPNKGIVALAHYTESDIPLYFKLAKAFTVCDASFCSINGPTDCNRSYFYTGTSNGESSNTPFSSVDDSVGSSGRASWKSYPERLEDLGIDWKFYQDALHWTPGNPFDGNYGDNTLEYYAQYRANFAATSSSPAYYASIFKKNQSVNSILRKGDGSKPSQFEQDIIDDKLPAVSWISAPEAFCEHPKWPPRFGEYYVHEILRAFAANVDVWKKTIFIITYDENGGFYDHVLPPVPPLSSSVGGLSPSITVTNGTTSRDVNSEATKGGSDQPLGMGIRIPTLVISPWSAGGRICSEVFDHTSAIQLVDTWLSAKGKQPAGAAFANISSWRQAIAGDYTSALDFNRVIPLTGPEAVIDTTQPAVIFTADQQAKAIATTSLNMGNSNATTKQKGLDAMNADPLVSKPTAVKQDKSRCEILPVDYDFFVGMTIKTLDDGSERVEYPITNRGKLGASFYVIPYDRTGKFPGDGPWFFSVEGSKGTAVTLTPDDAGTYAVFGAANAATKNYSYAVHGPNGYLFEFKGSAATPTERQLADITDCDSVEEGKTVRFTLKWPGANGSLKVINAYTGDIKTVSAGTGPSSVTVEMPTADGWYDIAFVDAVNTPSRYLRRYAGHLENGKIGKSDPAIGKLYNATTRVYDEIVLPA